MEMEGKSSRRLLVYTRTGPFVYSHMALNGENEFKLMISLVLVSNILSGQFIYIA